MTVLASPEIHSCPAFALQQLLTMKPLELFAIWKELPAPGMTELVGEYTGYLPITDLTEQDLSALQSQLYQEHGSIGYWLGKAFSTSDGVTGEGYNVWRTQAQGGETRYARNGRFTTWVGPSLVDGRPALMMDYTRFNNMPGRSGLVDEVRRLMPGLFLGTASYPTPEGGRTEGGGCFILVGPFNPPSGVDEPDRELLP